MAHPGISCYEETHMIATARETDIRLADVFESDMKAIGLAAYAEQTSMAEAIRMVHDAGNGTVGFIEAPTATGKTLVMAQHALASAAADGQPVVIATPTVEICHQTMMALSRLQDANTAYGALVTRLVLGRQEFVSANGAADFADALDAEGDGMAAAIVRQWHADGGPGPTERHPGYTRKGLEIALAAAGHEVEVPDWADLTHADDTDPADAEHAAQFDEAHVLVVTHAMLSRDLMKRYIAASRLRKAAGMRSSRQAQWWREAAEQRLQFETEVEGRLPDYRRLIVDEAHLLRSNLELALTTSVSIRQMIANVETAGRQTGVKVPVSAMPRLIAVQRAMSDHVLMSRGGRVSINWLSDQGFGALLEEAKDVLDQIRLPKTLKGQHQREIARARYALREALGARGAVRTTVEWSPGRSYPSIAVGPRGLGAEFGFLWGRLESACAVSATLYTENKDGSSIAYTAERLGVRPDVRMTFPPIRAAWMTDAVTVYTPGDTATYLIPTDSEERKPEWLQALAIAIAFAQETEARGTLVLSTSRALTNAIRDALLDDGEVEEDRIIDGTIGRIGAGRIAFEKMARAGRRPVWIVQGPAWTGLDLGDETIGTLVIPKLPFPPPRPGDTTGSKPTYDGEQVAHMMIELKQGVGRLVRSRNPLPKRAFILDGRMDGTGPARSANALLDQYKRKKI